MHGIGWEGGRGRGVEGMEGGIESGEVGRQWSVNGLGVGWVGLEVGRMWGRGEPQERFFR